MIATVAADPVSRMYALEAENSGLREALRCIRAEIEQDMVRDIAAVREAQRYVDAGVVEQLFQEAQRGKQIRALDLAELAERMRGHDAARRRAA
jgi:hypothetical protein